MEQLFVQTHSAKFQARITAHFGPEGAGIVGRDGSIDTEKLRELFAENRIDRIFDRLEKRYGDEIRKVVGDDGVIDFDALKKGSPMHEISLL